MEPQTFIFLGSSGSGKGTQVRKMNEYLASVDPERRVVKFYMGDHLREMWRRGGYSESRSRKLMEAGDLQPSFIQIYTWTQFFIDNLVGGEHLVIDGTPRRIEDSVAMDAAFKFYGRKRPNFIFLNISRSKARERLLARSRDSSESDLRSLEDVDERIEARLDWFERYVIPAVDFFRDNPDYSFIEVDGERSIDEVHASIVKQALNYDL